METKGKKETVYFFILNLFSKIFTYLALFVFANYFLVEEYGRAAFVLNIFNFSIPFIFFGLPDLFSVWMIKKRDTSTIFYLLLFSNLLFVLIGVLISLHYPWVLPLVLSLPFLLLNNISLAVFIVKRRYHMYQLFNSLTMIFVFSFVFALRSYGKLGIISSYFLSYALVSLITAYWNKDTLLGIIKNLKFNKSVAKQYIKKGLITSLIAISSSMLLWVNGAILGFYRLFELVAQYNIAWPIAGSVVLIPNSISFFLLTRTAEIKDEKIAKNLLKRAINLSVSFSWIYLMVILSSLSFILTIFFPLYQSIKPFVILLAAGIMLAIIYTIISMYFIGKLQPEKVLIALLLATVTNILLDFLLIPFFNLYGVTLATVFSYALAFSILSQKANMLKELCPIFFFSFLLLLTFYMEIYGLLLIFIGVPLLFKTKFLTFEDLNVVKQTAIHIFSKK